MFRFPISSTVIDGIVSSNNIGNIVKLATCVILVLCSWREKVSAPVTAQPCFCRHCCCCSCLKQTTPSRCPTHQLIRALLVQWSAALPPSYVLHATSNWAAFPT